MMRHLNWENCLNVRDLGGYATSDGACTRWRSIIRADNLCLLTPAGAQALIDYGVRTVIDLRSPSEVARETHPFAGEAARDGSPSYFNLPLQDELIETDATPMATDPLFDLYRENIDRYAANFGAVFKAIAGAPPGGVVLHCHAGKDRTGLVSALLLSLAGVPRQIIAEDYAATDRCLEPMYARIIANSPQEPTRLERLARFLVSPPETMLAVLGHLDARHGGVEAYLRAAGVTRPDVQRVRDRLRE
jgi:protein tyrosine/serine phosphatase